MKQPRTVTSKVIFSDSSAFSESSLNILGNIPSTDLLEEDEPTYPDPSFFSKTSMLQLGYGVWVGLGTSVAGLAYGYSSVAVPLLQKDQDLNMSKHQLNWFVSILTLSSPVGNVVSGYLADKLGRRFAIIAAELPMALGWLCISQASSPLNVIIGRAVTGLGIGMIMPPTRVFTSEICLPNMRGFVVTFLNLSTALGITTQAVLGMYVSWRLLSYINLSYSAFLFLLFMLLPETPYYVLMTSTEAKARQTLEKFRSKSHNIDAEMKEIINFKNINDIHALTFKEKLVFLMKPASCKPFWIINTFALITQLSGVTVLAFWTVIILDNSKCNVDSKVGNSLVGCSRIVGSILSSILTYSFRRRTLSFISCVGVFLAFMFLALNTVITNRTTLVPQICIMACVLFACIGLYSMPMLMMSEMYPLQVRGILGGLSVSFLNFATFCANMAFMPMIETVGFHWWILQYGIWALLGVIVLYHILPETKGLTLQEIEEYYNRKRPALTSQRQLQSDILMNRQSVVYNKRSQAVMSRKSAVDAMKSTTTIT